MGSLVLYGFQLNRINPSGGVSYVTMSEMDKKGFQLNRINPSGGVQKGLGLPV